jgi:hypothetical protein
MKIVEIHEYVFPSHLLAPLVNGDPVDEEDRESFDAFLDKLERYKKEYNATDYIIEYGKDSYFAKNNCLFDVGCNVTDIKVLFVS